MSYYSRCLQCQKKFYQQKHVSHCSKGCEKQWKLDLRKSCYFCGDCPYELIQVEGNSIACCKECIKQLNQIVVEDACCKAAYALPLFNHYEEKHKDLFKVGEWDDEELSELGHTLKSLIIVSLEAKHKIEAKLTWLKHISRFHNCKNY